MSIFCRAAAVGMVISRCRLAVVPQHFAGGCFDDLSKPWSDLGESQDLAMCRVTKVETIEGMPAAEMYRVRAYRHRHGFQSLIGLECAGLARQHTRDVLVH